MVFVNSKKYACESCIKGHRSSSCHHTDRPLFEIKKKGRPASQCEKCREARQNRQLHAKCECDARNKQEASQLKPVTKKGQRRVPTVPALPNGLRDAFQNSSTMLGESSNERNRVHALLNPCNCPSIYECKCNVGGSCSSNRAADAADIHPDSDEGLSALVQEASCCTPVKSPSPLVGPGIASSTPPDSVAKRHRHGHESVFKERASLGPASSLNDKPIIPSIRSIVLINPADEKMLGDSQQYPVFRTTAPPPQARFCSTETYCGCGYRCTCADCTLHRNQNGSSSAVETRKDCKPDCRTCVDHDGGIETPNHPSSGNPIFDKFFAQAAKLPPPPPILNKPRGISLDPNDVRVYPSTLFSYTPSEASTSKALGKRSIMNDAEEGMKKRAAFGLVDIPKLECCGGRCGCAGETCGCGKECDGCCDEGYAAASEHGRHDKIHEAKRFSPTATIPDKRLPLVGPGVGSCCRP